MYCLYNKCIVYTVNLYEKDWNNNNSRMIEKFLYDCQPSQDHYVAPGWDEINANYRCYWHSVLLMDGLKLMPITDVTGIVCCSWMG